MNQRSPNRLSYHSGRKPIVINGEEVLEWGIKVRQPITEDKRHTVKCNAITFRNTGNTTVIMDNALTLYPGDPFGAGDPKGIHMHCHEYHFKFILDSQPEGQEPMNRIEIVETTLHHPLLGNDYVEMGKVSMENS